MSEAKQKFQPILLGSDFNAYGMSRSFYEAYGIKSIAYGVTELAPTKYSKIVDVHVIPGLNEEATFMAGMQKIIATLEKDVTYLLIACGDGYAELISQNKTELEKYFICPYIDFDLFAKLIDKVSFYEVCEEYNLPYPKTKIINKEMVNDVKAIELPFSFPVALKPANSVEWLTIDFEGKKKAFIIKDRQEFETTLVKLYQAGYTDKMICQDFIPGDDSHMRVLNAYVDKNHQVRMMCLGHPLLEDPSPAAIGNYMVIMPDYNEKIYQQLQQFLEAINYTGFANFDMKYDERDGEYKLFEINLRQGRSSFYCTLNNYNLATYLVDDYINDVPYTETIFGKGDMLWLNVPVKVFEEYAKDNEYKTEAQKMIAADKYGTTAFYKKDKSIRHNLLMRHAFNVLAKNFKRYFDK